MRTTQLIRDKLGLSQENMAMHLKITLGQLAMYETGKRDLPTHALVKLAEILQFFDQKESKIDIQLQTTQELKVQEMMLLNIKELEYKHIKEERLLNKIKKKYNQGLQLYALGKHLESIQTEQSSLLIQLATTAIEKNSLVHQTKKLLKLESFESQLRYCNFNKQL
jgi:transcriptional regulator with XRE-family HTH domain